MTAVLTLPAWGEWTYWLGCALSSCGAGFGDGEVFCDFPARHPGDHHGDGCGGRCVHWPNQHAGAAQSS